MKEELDWIIVKYECTSNEIIKYWLTYTEFKYNRNENIIVNVIVAVIRSNK